jgi:D-glycero-alpha-D-manno-heptose-7-phosphate kinase
LNQTILVKTPLRVSFLGGGTDTKDFIEETGNSIIFGSSINLFVYTMVNKMPPFAEYPYRFTYRIVENVNNPYEIKHPLVRETLKEKSWENPINIATLSDVPGNSGLGSSSAFAVSFNHALAAFQGIVISDNLQLASDAVRLEREILQEPGGIQDQYHCALGGLRFYNFKQNGVEISEDFSSSKFGRLLNQRLYLIWSGSERSDRYAHPTVTKVGLQGYKSELREIAGSFMSKFDRDVAEDTYESLADCVNASWKLKKEIIGPKGVGRAGEIVDLLIKLGVDAAKVCGAGGGGFVLALAREENWSPEILQAVGDGNVYKILTDSFGSRVIHL